ncbi:TonB-dependent receptor [Chitinophaga tropicalis]|uniref:TonB-dependent receptor plug domain-containing protein n=1 Tax=Chitinophaga tropicalis TaxID=2683588 RepID=A0A7K1U5Y4_9BACT|nr:TonB-dependent receptor [Chitinophaga tropicalis]MVT09783.1 TonB-dependent receptor plug domain-containing protein [Chitinophaga tropicalis]
MSLGKILLGVLFICLPGQVFGWDWRTKVTVVLKDRPLEEVCGLLEKEYGIRFSYSRNIVDLSRRITVNIHNKPLKKALEEIFDPYNIRFARIGEQIVLTEIKHPVYTVSGYVQDIRTGEKLIGATIYSPRQEAGTITNQYGFFSLTLARDTSSLWVSYIGYVPQRLAVKGVGKSQVSVVLTPKNSLPEIVVTDSVYARSQTNLLTGRMSVSPADVKSMPRLLGEADVMRAIVALPGVSGGIDGGGALNVRGGSPDQNLVLLDGTPVFSASHLFGIFSVFNPDIVKDAAFYKGAFPARYGGRLSSVVDISLKDGDMKQYHGEAAIGLIAAKAMVEGPIKKDKTSFVVSGRRSYTDLLEDNLFNSTSENGDENRAYVYFYDANLKVNHIFSERDRIHFSVYTGQDKLVLNRASGVSQQDTVYETTKTRFSWGNYTGTLRWNHVFNPKLFANTTGNYSQYYFYTDYSYNYKPVSREDTIKLFGKYYSRMQDAVIRMDLEYRPGPNHTFKFGGGAITHIFTPGVSRFEDKGSGEKTVDTSYGAGSTVGGEVLLYAEDEWKVLPSLQMNIGLHTSGFLVQRTFYGTLQPRLGAIYRLPKNWSLKASYTHMTQYLHLLTSGGIDSPTDLWVPSTGKVRPMYSRQASAGVFKTTNNRMYTFSLESYYKIMDHVIEYKEYTPFINTSPGNWDDKVVSGRGRSYGGEIMLEKKKGTTRGWIGYTLSWSERRFPGVNGGTYFPYKYDRRHDLELVLNQRLGKHWDLSASWEYTSGLPLTLPTGSYEGVGDGSPYDFPDNVPILDWMGKRNQYRTQSMHRLDISATYSKKKKWWVKSWTFSLYNAYNQHNPFFFVIVTDRKKQERYLSEISILPILPSVTYSVKF